MTATPALAARGHVFKESFAEPGSGPGQLTEPAGLAVNEASGDLYVVDKGNNRVERYSSTGTYLGTFDGSGAFEVEGSAETGPAAGSGGEPSEVEAPLLEPEGIAVDNSTDPEDPSAGDVYVVDTGHRVIDKFTARGEYIAQLTFPHSGFTFIAGVAVGPAGELSVAEENTEEEGSPKNVKHFTNALLNAPSGPLVRLPGAGFLNGFGLVPGFAADSHGGFYVSNHNVTGVVSKFNSKGELLNPELDEEPTGLAVESSSDNAYVDHGDAVARFDSEGNLIERLTDAGLTNGTGLTVDSSTGNVFTADASSGKVLVFALEEPGAPTIESVGVTSVTSNTATLTAEINPRGAQTEYRFEYGPCATPATCSTSPYQTSVPVPDGQLAADFEIHSLSAAITGLQPHTPYHFRVIAHNEIEGVEEVAESKERSFTTQSSSASFLPDSRQWELVSPPEKRGAALNPIQEAGIIQAAADGTRIAYIASAPTEPGADGNSNESHILSYRSPDGWSSRDIATPHSAPTGRAGGGPEYRAFSADLSLSLDQPQSSGFQPLSPAASEQTLYLRTNFNGSEPCASECYRPLVTGCPAEPQPCPPAIAAAANVPPGTEFASPNAGPSASLAFRGATPGLGHVVFEATENSAPLTPGGAVSGGFYEWSNGSLTFIGIPNGRPSFKSISADGSRVVFAGSASGLEGLLLRDTMTGQLLKLDEVTEGSGEGPAGPVFQYATPDGSKVFFTDTQRLTDDAGAATGQPDLYQCELTELAGGELTCRLSDLTPPGPGGEAAQVVGRILGSSTDGSYLYFVANGVLANNVVDDGAGPKVAQPGVGGCAAELPPPNATCNLYLYHAGAIIFVATISGADKPNWLISTLGPRGNTARVSPNGHWLAFMSERPLTGFDNRDAVSGQRDEEVLLYHALGEGLGRLTCASCNPSGARPFGVEYLPISTGEGGLAGGDRVWEPSDWIAANVPGWTEYEATVGIYQSRYLSDSGRLFFNSSDALLPQDSNATEDVYESEPLGVGGCSEQSSTYSSVSGACLGLISSGTSKSESAFLDASENGDDVFFLSSARLTGADVDTAIDVYDAHACSAASPCLPEPPPPAPLCAGDACQQPAVPPFHPTPGTSLLNGPENLTECPKGKVKQKGKCVAKKSDKKKHHKKKGHKNHKRANSRHGGQK